MSTSKELIVHMMDLCSVDERVRARAMFGEYALYYGDKLPAMVCDDTLFLKQTDAGRDLAGEVELASPYYQAKLHLKIPEEMWEQPGALVEMLKSTAADLPAPKPKKAKSAK